MYVVFDREPMLKSFAVVASVTSPKAVKAVLQNVLLDAEAGELTGSDGEIRIVRRLPGLHISRSGRVLLPVDRVSAILRECTDQELSLETVDNSLVVKGQSCEFKLPTANPDEFPTSPQEIEPRWHECQAKQLQMALKRTIFAAEDSTGRYALNAILFECKDDRIDLVASDGRRMSHAFTAATCVGGHTTEGITALVPIKTARILLRTLSDEGDVRVAFTPNSARFEYGETTLESRLVEGRYPAWQKVIPENGRLPVELHLPAGPFNSIIRQAAITSDVETRGMDVALDGGSLRCRSAAQIGSSRVEMPIAYEDSPLEIRLDYRYMRDWLDTHEPASAVCVRLADSKSAAKFESEGCEYVVMPMAKE
jgi:DNA polymerase III subunit beta